MELPASEPDYDERGVIGRLAAGAVRIGQCSGEADIRRCCGPGGDDVGCAQWQT